MKMKKIFASALIIVLCLSLPSIGAQKGKARRVIKPKVVIKAPVVRPVIIAPRVIRPVVIQPLPPSRPVVVVKEKAPPKPPHEGPEFGLSGGLFGNIPSVGVDAWFHKILGIGGTGIKAGLRYAQGEDSNKNIRKNILICADGIYDFNSGPGAIFYLAGGLNYLAYTTGQTNGGVGAELYLGVEEGSFAYGSLYAEAGYSAIRTGFSPTIKGLYLNFGIKSVL